MGPTGGLGIWGEWLYIFRGLGNTGIYLRGAGEQAHSFGDFGSSVKKHFFLFKTHTWWKILHFVCSFELSVASGRKGGGWQRPKCPSKI